ncbi:MAG: N-acetylmuramoyl-L-alanine amidase [Candidatus Pacearchaeota archaeon]
MPEMSLLKEVMYLLLTVFLIIAVIGACTNIYGNFLKSKEEQQAKETLTNLINFLRDIKNENIDSFIVYAPQGYWLVSYDKIESSPIICASQNCICICKDKDCPVKSEEKYCNNIEKPLKKDGKSISMQIKIMELYIKNNPTEYSILSVISEQGTLKEYERTTIPEIKVNTSYTLQSKPRDKDTKINTIVLHHTAGTNFIEAYNFLKNSGNSVHYIIDRDGKIYYLVDETQKAIHAGYPYNDFSIGIELVSTGCKNFGYTDAQYSSLNNLIKDIIKRWPDIKYDDKHIIGHYETLQGMRDRKIDPSNFDWARIGLPNHIPSTATC